MASAEFKLWVEGMRADHWSANTDPIWRKFASLGKS